MQRAQRGVDNPALDVAVSVAIELDVAVVTFFAPVPFYLNANLRHFQFLAVKKSITKIHVFRSRRSEPLLTTR